VFPTRHKLHRALGCGGGKRRGEEQREEETDAAPHLLPSPPPPKKATPRRPRSQNLLSIPSPLPQADESDGLTGLTGLAALVAHARAPLHPARLAYAAGIAAAGVAAGAEGGAPALLLPLLADLAASPDGCVRAVAVEQAGELGAGWAAAAPDAALALFALSLSGAGDEEVSVAAAARNGAALAAAALPAAAALAAALPRLAALAAAHEPDARVAGVAAALTLAPAVKGGAGAALIEHALASAGDTSFAVRRALAGGLAHAAAGCALPPVPVCAAALDAFKALASDRVWAVRAAAAGALPGAAVALAQAPGTPKAAAAAFYPLARAALDDPSRWVATAAATVLGDLLVVVGVGMDGGGSAASPSSRPVTPEGRHTTNGPPLPPWSPPAAPATPGGAASAVAAAADVPTLSPASLLPDDLLAAFSALPASRDATADALAAVGAALPALVRAAGPRGWAAGLRSVLPSLLALGGDASMGPSPASSVAGGSGHGGVAALEAAALAAAARRAAAGALAQTAAAAGPPAAAADVLPAALALLSGCAALAAASLPAPPAADPALEAALGGLGGLLAALPPCGEGEEEALEEEAPTPTTTSPRSRLAAAAIAALPPGTRAWRCRAALAGQLGPGAAALAADGAGGAATLTHCWAPAAGALLSDPAAAVRSATVAAFPDLLAAVGRGAVADALGEAVSALDGWRGRATAAAVVRAVAAAVDAGALEAGLAAPFMKRAPA